MTPRRTHDGFTLVELLVGMAISATALTGILVASFSLQRSFAAANYRMSAQEDQLRTLDYITRDLHSASGLSITNGGTSLSTTLPAATSSTLDLNLGPLLTPLLGSLFPTATATPTVVLYYVDGGQLIREVNGTQSVIADTIADLTFTRSGASVTVDVTFTPQYSNSPTTATQPVTRASSCVLLYNAGLSK